MTLQIRLFGHLQVGNQGDRAAVVLRPRAQRLLAFLLLHRRAAISRQRIAFELWTDSLESEASATLRRALSDLRVGLPLADRASLIRVGRDRLQWNCDAPYWLDIEAFEELIKQSSPASLADAVALYTGDLLAEWDDEWIVVEREQLRQGQIGALHRLVAHHRALGEYEQARHLARAALELDPLAEALHRELMAVYYEAGDRTGALAQFGRLRDRLRHEVGAEPMAETQALRDSIVRGGPLPTGGRDLPRLSPVAPAIATSPRPIGRENEMARLEALWESTAAGRGHCALVSGEVGVGKTYLARGFARHAALRGGLVLIGHSLELEHALPFQPIAEMLRAAADRLRRADLSYLQQEALDRLAPEVLGKTIVPAAPAGSFSGDVRAQVFEALFQIFLRLARSQPLLLLVEDVHWADSSTLDWLTFLAHRVGASRLLLVITFRTGEVGDRHALPRLRRRLQAGGALAAITLAPLSREANRRLVAHLSGLRGERLIRAADRLFTESAGNPFFVHEIVRGLLDVGELIVKDSSWTGPFVDADPETRIVLPDSLRETIAARVARLPATDVRFMQLAAVAGRVFDYRLIREAAGWTEEQALETIEDLLARGFVREGPGDGMCSIAHHLVREAIYADLAVPRRRHWHRQLARTLVQTAGRLPPILRPPRAGLIVHHALAAEDYALVPEWALLAAQHAYALYAYADAMKALDAAAHALERLRHDPDFDLESGERKQTDVLLDKAALISLVGRPLEEQAHALQAAAELLARYPDERQEAKYYLGMSDYFGMLSEYERAIEAALEAHARYRQLGDCPGAARSLHEAGRYRITLSQNRTGGRLLEEALALYQAAGDRAGEALCLSSLAWAKLNLGQVAAALAHLTHALELSERRADRLGMARICFTLAAAWSYYHNPAQVELFAERSLGLYRDLGLAPASHRPLLYIAEAHRLRGESAQAEEVIERVVAAAQSNHDSWLEGWATQMLGRLTYARGALHEAEDRLAAAYRLRRASGEVQNQVSDLTWLGRLRLAQAEPAAALEYSGQAIAQLDGLWGEFYVWEMPDVLLVHAEALAANGDSASATVYLRRAYDTLMQFAAQIDSPTVKQEFLAYPPNAAVIAAAQLAGRGVTP